MKPQQWKKSLFVVILSVLFAPSIWGVLPVRAADEDVNAKILDYYRRKQNLPPEINTKIKDVRDSPIPGLKAATIELSRGNQKQDVGMLMSADGRYVVFGEVEDVTTDPFAELAKKITIKDSPVRGPKDAPITIVEFSDFQCPYCARAHETVNQVLKEYGDKVKLVYKNYPLPFHKWAEPAAILDECAFEQDEKAFWTLYDYYFTNQRELTPDNLKEKTIEALKGTKVDPAKLTACFDSKQTADKVKADMAEGQAAGVTGTPAFLINGRKISGAQPLENFKAVIDDELKRAPKS